MKKLMIAVGALAVGLWLLPEDAEAQRGGFRGGGGAGFRAVGGGFGGGAIRGGGFRGGFAGPAIRGGGFGVGGGPRYGYGYRPGLGRPGFYRPGFPYRPVYGGFYGRRYGYGGAVAAGLIGGLALGGLAYGGYGYGYPYGYGGYGYGYGDPYYGAGYDDGCVLERRRAVTPSGQVVIRRVRVCEY